MRNLHISALSALLLGAATLTAPALAATDNPANAAQSDNSQPSSQSEGDNSANANANTQVAMNNSNNSSASDLSSIPDNSHKFSRSKLSSENASERPDHHGI